MGVIHAKAAVFDRVGGADVLELRSVSVPPPGAGELRIRINAVGLNRSEAMFREGSHPIRPELPSRLGYEAAWVIESVGTGVTRFAVGDRVSTLPIMELNARGAYGEMFTVPEALVVHSSEELTDEETASLWSSYMTAYGMLVEDRPDRNERAIDFIRRGVREGWLKPLICRRFSLDEVRSAASDLDSLQQIGKIIIVPNRPDN